MSHHSQMEKFTFATGTNAQYMETLYRQFKEDPESVDVSWRRFFEGYEFGSSSPVAATEKAGTDEGSVNAKVEALINAYRRLGHLSAHLNPLEDKRPVTPELQADFHGLSGVKEDMVVHPANLPDETMKFGDVLRLLQDTYCGHIGADYREINKVEEVVWLQAQMEACRNRPTFSTEEKKRILTMLTKTEGFERFLQDRYLGQKRFSVEGTDALLPLMDFLADEAAANGVKEINLGMAHRGRLNVLANFMDKPFELLLREFEGTEFNPFDIDGDVKYHLGFASDVKTFHNHDLRLFLLPNPSHLEAVNPVVEGFSRARQEQELEEDGKRGEVLPLLIHGDAAFIGQGVVAETLNLTELESYGTGGTVHIIINNQIGFTAEPEEGRSCTYSSEIAKMVRAPVFHVNADDPEAVAWTARLAARYRQKFGRDVVIDLIGYRRHGHNETDEPSFTQPLMYKTIKRHPTCWKIYASELAEDKVVSDDESKEMMKEFRGRLQKSLDAIRKGGDSPEVPIPGPYQPILAYRRTGRKDWEEPVETKITQKAVKDIGAAISTLPEGFQPHSKIKRLFENRQKMLAGKGSIDWGLAELIAYGSLAKEGHKVRLSGQDSRRGTFSHRHAVLRDFETGERLHVLNRIDKDQAPVEVINSPLSEAGVMGFEFGYSVASPQALTLWEAQFGDFVNGAQILIDQFLVASEAKWKQTCSLVLLLPHGYEGMGPEHSSARPERFLQLCGNLNIQMVNPTTPAQLFHVLRRQVRRAFRKPLVVMSPKSLLRHPKVISTIKDFSDQSFQEVLGDGSIAEPEKVERIVLCSGKVYYELAEERAKHEELECKVALVRLEQLYPFPDKALPAALAPYKNANSFTWTQEEPENMGAWYFLRNRLESLFGNRFKVEYVGRKGSGSTAEGSNKAHQQEQHRIIQSALGLACSIQK